MQEGVTDFDKERLWEQLDVQVRYRYVGATDFTSAYVNFGVYQDYLGSYGVCL